MKVVQKMRSYYTGDYYEGRTDNLGEHYDIVNKGGSAVQSAVELSTSKCMLNGSLIAQPIGTVSLNEILNSKANGSGEQNKSLKVKTSHKMVL